MAPRLLLDGVFGARGVRGVGGTFRPVRRREAREIVSRMVICLRLAMNQRAQRVTLESLVFAGLITN